MQVTKTAFDNFDNKTLGSKQWQRQPNIYSYNANFLTKLLENEFHLLFLQS